MFLLDRRKGKTLNAPNGSPGTRLRPVHSRTGTVTLHHHPGFEEVLPPPQGWQLGLTVFWFSSSPLHKGLDSELCQAQARGQVAA